MPCGVHGKPAELAYRPALVHDRDRVQHKSPHLITPQLQMDTRGIIDYCLVFLVLLRHGLKQHKDAIGVLLVRQPDGADLRFIRHRLCERQGRVAPRRGRDHGVITIDQQQKLTQLLGQNDDLLLLDGKAQQALRSSRLQIKRSPAWFADIIGCKDVWVHFELPFAGFMGDELRLMTKGLPSFNAMTLTDAGATVSLWNRSM